MSVFRRAAGTLDILRAWPGQRRVPFEPLERQYARRDERLRDTVSYAARHVPYYRSSGLDPRAVVTASDLARLPIVSRDDLLAAPSFRSDRVREGDGLVIRSSGSSGEPLDVLHDRSSALANIAYSERERAIDAGFIGKEVYRALSFEYRNATLVHVRSFYDAAAFRPRRPGLTNIPSDDGAENALEALRRDRPDLVIGSGAWLDVVFRAVAVAQRPVPLPKLVVYGGSGLPDQARALIENELGVPVLSRYNASESLKIGYTCEQRDGFHLHEDLCAVEIVRPDGTAAEEGELGAVVISNLVNRGTVLLRYRLGDHGRIVASPCACGRQSRRLFDLDGKTNVIVRLPDGTAVHSRTLWGVIKSVEGVRRFQIVQHEPARFEVKLVTDDRATYDAMLPTILTGMQRLLPGCTVEPTWHEALEPVPGSRFATIVALDLDE